MHLELHTGDLGRARDFYASLLGSRFDRLSLEGTSYLAMTLGGAITGGIVECPTGRPGWLPYVIVENLHAVTARAEALDASVLLAPREGPAGWRSVIAGPASGEVALWEPKRDRSPVD